MRIETRMQSITLSVFQVQNCDGVRIYGVPNAGGVQKIVIYDDLLIFASSHTDVVSLTHFIKQYLKAGARFSKVQT